MNLDEYTKLAIRTESQIETVTVNRELLEATINGMAAFGQILDQIKKHVYYGKAYNIDELSQCLETGANSISAATIATVNNPGENECDVHELNTRVFHSISGIATESVELLEVLQKVLAGEEIDLVNALEEFYDINWYQAIGIDELHGDWEGGLANNIAKLKARFPDKFDSDQAINRNKEAEREILEKMVEKQ